MEMGTKAGVAAAPLLCHLREGTHGTATALLARSAANLREGENMMTPSSIIYWRARRGGGEGTEVPRGWTMTVTLPPRAALEARAATVTIAGRRATVLRRMIPCLHTQKWSDTAQNVSAWNPLIQNDTGPLTLP